MASSSSTPQARSIVSPKMYDVFISHRGPDVKETLAKQLYDLLEERGCKAFLDLKEIGGGDSITSALHNAICSSRVQIAIFSKGYAESKWCLDELLLMLQQTDALFIPVFYGVEPKELRSTDRGSYAAAFSYYQSKDKYLNKVDTWKEALASAADISGYEDSVHKDNLCERIVSRVVQVIKKKEESIPLHVAEYPVGLGELVQDFERCCSNTAGVVGIFGLGGSGKTTLAKQLFNKKRSAYHKSCFLSDVKHSHANLQSLQKQLLKDLFEKDQEITSVDDGIGKLKYFMGRTEHLNFHIVLDDIDHEDQINALLPEGMLGSGRLIIITTRDQSVLRGADVLYKMKRMEKDHAKELFCSYDFRLRGCRNPPPAFEKLVENFEEYCGGLPLSLKVLGAHLYGRKEDYWNLELQKVTKIQPKDIRERLKISFDGLDKEEKQIFIDIACFFNKKYVYDLKSKAITIWKASQWSAELALRTLQKKCLLEVVLKGGNYIFEMHDHLRDLGRYIADELCPLFPHELGSPRLWRPDILRSMEAKGFEKIIEETKGRCFHWFGDSSLGRQIAYFMADTDLLWLEIGDVCKSVNLVSIPSWIPLLKLHVLDVWRVEEFWINFQQQLQAKIQATLELRKLRIWYCLSKPPYWSMEMLNHLEELEIDDSLEKADTTSLVHSLKQLSNLRSLDLRHEECFGRTPNERRGRDSIDLDSCRCSCLKSLETIRLHGLQTISNLVISGDMCPKLRSLVVSRLKYLNEMELKQLQSLNTLAVGHCRQLEKVSGVSSLTGLQQLKVQDCEGLKMLPSLAHLLRLEEITIVDCPELQSVEGVEHLLGLKSLVIQMPDDGYAHGLRMPSAKKIILTQKATDEVSHKLNAKLFSEVIGDEAVTEIESGEWGPKIESSSNSITIYTLLITAAEIDCLVFEDEVFCVVPNTRNLLITFLLDQHDSEDRLHHSRVEKGFKAMVKVEEEGKALNVLQRTVSRLYRHKMVPNLAAYDVVKRKRKQRHWKLKAKEN